MVQLLGWLRGDSILGLSPGDVVLSPQGWFLISVRKMKHRPEAKADDEQEDKADDKEEDGEVPMLDKEFDDDDEMGEDVELDVPAEDKFTNDLDPQK